MFKDSKDIGDTLALFLLSGFFLSTQGFYTKGDTIFLHGYLTISIALHLLSILFLLKKLSSTKKNEHILPLSISLGSICFPVLTEYVLLLTIIGVFIMYTIFKNQNNKSSNYRHNKDTILIILICTPFIFYSPIFSNLLINCIIYLSVYLSLVFLLIYYSKYVTFIDPVEV